MPYIGKVPAAVPINASDIPDDSITTAKIKDGVITIDDIGADAVGLSELSATGTASSTTYLRGDNSWATVSAGVPTTLTATSNIGLGSGAVDSITTGDWNVGLGDNALTACTTGSNNLAFVFSLNVFAIIISYIIRERLP